MSAGWQWDRHEGLVRQMKIEKEWTASSKSERLEKNEELVNMAGLWGVGIDVLVTKPFTYSWWIRQQQEWRGHDTK